MKTISVDPSTRTVRVGGGCTWGEVDAATTPHDLAVPTGIISSTGVAGLTLGGGHGYLSRRYGLTIDNLLSAEMVLADGSQVTASADEHPDLFWAIRGGGGNFGVVTEFTFQARPGRDDRRRADVLGDRGRPTSCCRLPRVAPVGSAQRDGVLQLPHDPARRRGVPGGDPQLRKVCGIVWCIDACDEEAEQAMAPMLCDRGAAHATAPGGSRSPRSTAPSTGSTAPATSGTGAATSCGRSRTRRSA